jgi:hypothetical protein
LYRGGSPQTETLLCGEVGAIADQQSKFTASSARRSELVSDGMSAMSSDLPPLHGCKQRGCRT